MKFEYLPHTADIKFRAYGDTLEQRFKNAALAMCEVIFSPDKVEKKIEKKISVQGNDEKHLLVNFLNELLFYLDSEFFFIRTIKNIMITKADKFHLTATLIGDNTEGRYTAETGVKAATYQEMEITDDYVQVVVDI